MATVNKASLLEALPAWKQAAVKHLPALPALHVDETSLRVDGNDHWIHVHAARPLTVKSLHAKRGCAAMENLGILQGFD